MLTNDSSPVSDSIASSLKIRAGASGLHLFNRSTGVNLLLDEIRLPTDMWAMAPRYVSIALTNACDLACRHCYAPKNPAQQDFEQLISWLDELDANGCIGVGFGGGEPTLYPRLAELCAYVAKNTRMAVTMTTHAHHLNAPLLEKLAGSVHFFRVSMDGVGVTYESIRGRSFSSLIQRIDELSKIARFGINFVVNSKTIGDLDKAIDLALQLNCSEFLLLPEESTPSTGGIDRETKNMLHRWIANYRHTIPLAINKKGADGLPVCNPFDEEAELNAFAHIDALGTLKRSSYDAYGVRISKSGVIKALRELTEDTEESD